MPHKLSLVALLVVGSAAPAGTFSVSTAAHQLPSSGAIEVYVGALPPDGLLVFRSEVLSFVGGGTLTTNFDPSDTGRFQTTLNLQLEDVPTTHVDLGSLGTMDVAMTGISLVLTTGNVLATSGHFSVGPFSAGNLRIPTGTVQATNTTGILGSLLPSGYFYDFATRPVNIPIGDLLNSIPGTVDDGLPHFSRFPELNIGNPTFNVDTLLFQPAFIRVVAEVHVAAIPESPAWTFGGIALGVLYLANIWNRKLSPQ